MQIDIKELAKALEDRIRKCAKARDYRVEVTEGQDGNVDIFIKLQNNGRIENGDRANKDTTRAGESNL